MDNPLSRPNPYEPEVSEHVLSRAKLTAPNSSPGGFVAHTSIERYQLTSARHRHNNKPPKTLQQRPTLYFFDPQAYWSNNSTPVQQVRHSPQCCVRLRNVGSSLSWFTRTLVPRTPYRDRNTHAFWAKRVKKQLQSSQSSQSSPAAVGNNATRESRSHDRFALGPSGQPNPFLSSVFFIE